MLIADRHSEHVACAAGRNVLAAGEVFFVVESPSSVHIDEISNQSTGYCPRSDCWEAVALALDRIGLSHPRDFTTICTFRKCGSCGERNIVKDGWFYCDVCGEALPEKWNFTDLE
ncbi:hypothetical protein [Humisphaera borealis]|uniref:hypothetical protein n=1 Tax=Humisphaera borealis TaxID=2807512 RepID=UPI0019D2EA81|nr:hypothetical protein [Humisphaera borealis]